MAVDDSYSVALLHMDGDDASTTFTDEAGTTWTVNGNAQIDTAHTVSGFGETGLFDGAGDYLSAPDSAAWQLDNGSDSNLWTIDFRIRFDGDPGTATVGIMQQSEDADNDWHIALASNSLYFVVRAAGSNTVVIDNAWNPANTTWYHIAIVKNGTSGYMMFVNGSQIGTTQTDTSTIPDFAGPLHIGKFLENYLNGSLDEVRISKGIARWTANFTPPTSAYEPLATDNNGLFFSFM